MKNSAFSLQTVATAMAGIACVAALAACQSAAPPPEHKYYRLLGASAAASPQPAQAARLQGEVSVRPLRSEALYSERAIIYTDAQQRQLQQYHYHHWMYQPSVLIQEHLAHWLRRSGTAPGALLQEQSHNAAYAVSGRIVRFEKIAVNGQPKAVVSLDLRLDKKNKMLLQKNYEASEAIPDASVNSFTASTEAALNRIYAEFARDIAAVRLD